MKKFERKLRKHKNALLREGIVCCENSTKNIIISNVGLVNGLSEETLVESLQAYGEISDILLPPGKSYCFVCFKTEESAQNCFAHCNGVLNIAQDGKPVFMLFVEQVPTITSKRMWNLPPGLIILEDFITEDEEDRLMKFPEFDDIKSSSMKNRQVKHFGYEFKYDINNVDENEPIEKIPEEYCDILWDRLGNRCETYNNFIPDQLTINKYLPGQGIPSHVDTHSAFIDPIMSLSLGSPIVMDFKNESEHYCVLLPRRSLTIMSQESRYLWSHGITPRKYDVMWKNNHFNLLMRKTRISYTFRKLRKRECDCEFKSKCDSFAEQNKAFCLDEEVAVELEKKHVHDVYENIADHFSDTRHKPWPNVMNFVKSLEVGSILVDIGCGNGKYLGINENIFNLGCDRSFGLADVCKDRDLNIFACDCLSLPLKSNMADACICIAVIHHLATEARRSRAISEIQRILKPGGKALIYVWAKNQCSNNTKSNYLKENSCKNNSGCGNLTPCSFPLPIHTNRTQFEHKDLLVPWKLKKNSEEKGTFLRFYHVYEENELEHCVSKIDNLIIESSYYDQGNWCVLFRKIKT